MSYLASVEQSVDIKGSEMEMDLKKAYQIMGIEEDATIDKLEDQYMLWIRKEKAQHDQKHEGALCNGDSIDMDEITEAYNFIKNPNSSPTESEERKIGKIAYFFSYYKYYAIGLLTLVIVVGYLVYNVIDYRIERAALANLPAPDIEILMMGNFDIDLGNIPLENTIKGEFPEWENVEINVERSLGAEMDYADRMVMILTLREEEPDIYLVDEYHFDILAEYELLLPISIDHDLKEQMGDHALEFYQLEGEDEQLYGVDVSEITIFNDVQLGNDKIIASIRADASKPENALELLLK